MPKTGRPKVSDATKSVRARVLEEAKAQNRDLRRERANRIPVRVLVAPKLFKELVKLARAYERTTQAMAEELIKMAVPLFRNEMTPYGEGKPLDVLGLYRKPTAMMRPPMPPNPHSEIEMEAARERPSGWIGSDAGLPTTRRRPFARLPAADPELPQEEPAVEEEVEFEVAE